MVHRWVVASGNDFCKIRSFHLPRQTFVSISSGRFTCSLFELSQDVPFSHHYQGIAPIGVYFFIFTCNRDDIEGYDLQRSYFPIHSLLPRECIGKYCPSDSIPRYTSLCEKIIGQSLGPWGAKSPPLGNLSVLRGCISQYIPPLGSVPIH